MLLTLGLWNHFGAAAASIVRCGGDIGGAPGALPSRADPTWKMQQKQGFHHVFLSRCDWLQRTTHTMNKWHWMGHPLGRGSSSWAILTHFRVHMQCILSAHPSSTAKLATSESHEPARCFCYKGSSILYFLMRSWYLLQGCFFFTLNSLFYYL